MIAAATVLTLFLAKQAAADEYVLINTVSDFTKLVRNVNNYRYPYTGTTVLLNADLDFDGVSTAPIGIGWCFFQGAFDGQGHTISNLNVKSTDRYAGLFGNARNIIIQNVVLDSSCSFESTYTSGPTYTGGILGYSYTTYGNITIDNCVNMASVSYNQPTSSYSYLGGIVGYHSSHKYDISITNCANFGKVTRTSTYYYNYIGGIAGAFYSSSDYEASIVNCANYGTVSVASSSGSKNYMGGIVGFSRANEIRNCLSVGAVQIPSDATVYVGSITGYSNDYNWMSIEHCVWSNSTTGQDGFGNIPSTVTISDCYDVKTVNETTMDGMNENVTDGSRWVFSENYPVSLVVSGRKAIVYNANAILLFNSFTNAAGNYSGWYTDSDCTNLLESSLVTQTTLYGKWAPVYFTATFIFWDDINETKTFKAGDTVRKPLVIPERENYVFDGWNSGYSTMPLKDITITAKWKVIKYQMIFNFSYGEDPIVEKFYEYNDTVEYPDVEPRTGYEFIEWDKNITNMPAENVTVTASWKIIDYTLVFYDEDSQKVIESHTLHYEDIIPYPSVTRENYRFKSWNYTRSKMPAKNLTITVEWEKIPTDRVDVTLLGTLDKDGVAKAVKEYTDANIVVLDPKSAGNNKTTATIVFEDVYQAQEFMDTVEREMAVGVDSAVGPKVVCDYNYSGEKKPHRPSYESGAVSLVMSAAALLFIF